jgi:hypothetical protein
LATLALVLSSDFVGGAQAFPITYDFTVTGTTGPLAGTVAHGSFSYDSSSILPPPQINNQTGLLTSLSFTWNGVHYTQATANTGSLGFDARRNLTSTRFGTNCTAGGCNNNPALNDDQFSVDYFGPSSNFFIYTVPGMTAFPADLFDGTVTIALAPEPASLTLLAMGIAGLGLVLRTRRA